MAIYWSEVDRVLHSKFAEILGKAEYNGIGTYIDAVNSARSRVYITSMPNNCDLPCIYLRYSKTNNRDKYYARVFEKSTSSRIASAVSSVDNA